MLQFESKELRVVEAPVNDVPQKVVPLNDVADVIGYDRSILHQMVARSQILKETSVSVTLTRAGKIYHQTALTYEGVIGLLNRVTPERIPDLEKRERVFRFQRWSISILAKVMRGEIATQDHHYELAGHVQALTQQVAVLTKSMQAHSAYPAPANQPKPVKTGRKWTEEGIADILSVMADFEEFTLFDIMVHCGVRFGYAAQHMNAALLRGQVRGRWIDRRDFPENLLNFTHSARCQILTHVQPADASKVIDLATKR